MIKPEMVPDEVIVAFRRTLYDGPPRETWDEHYAAAISAALNAWPGMKLTPWWEFMTHKRRVDLILPLPEKADD